MATRILLSAVLPFSLLALSACSSGATGNAGDGSSSSGSGSGSSSGTTSSSGSGSSSGGISGSSSGSSSGSASGSGSGSGSSSGSSSSGSSSGASTDGGADDAGALPTGDGGAGLFAHCSLDAGCLASCAPPADDPIATGKADDDQYDGCILAAMQVAGLTEPWMGQLLKSQAVNESNIVPVITTQNQCGGQNCGIWAISAGAASGDSPPGPCGVKAADPSPGSGGTDYSHSYGIFQSTPACEGTFIQPLPAGETCTDTGTADIIPFGTQVRFYCETATSEGVQRGDGTTVKGAINAVQDTTSPYYATSVFNPAYQLFVYITYSWKFNFEQANAGATGCTVYQQWYLSLAYWLTGNATKSCTLTGDGLQYVKDAESNYKDLYGKTWPYPGP